MYLLSVHVGLGDRFAIVAEASPGGMGGVLLSDDISLLSSLMTSQNMIIKVLGFPEGESSGQQAWEALGMLVALRIWKDSGSND